MDLTTFSLVGGVLALLGAAAGVGHLLKQQTDGGLDPAVVEHFNLRVRAWWLLCAMLAATFMVPFLALTYIFFAALSFWALREFITVTPTREADHRTLFWVLWVFTPVQYILVGNSYYQLYSIAIPVYGFLFIPVRMALAGDFKRYLERCAKIQAGLMICVYCLSYAPALLGLDIPNYDSRRLLFFFVLVTVAGDAMCYGCEKLMGKHVIAPAISSQKTWEGFLGGVGCTTLLGMALTWATPFNVIQTAGLSLVITTMGFAGGLTMSAIKRDRGVRDYGTLVEGHGGVLDRIDSICFAAPIFFHLTQYILQLR